MALPKRNPPRQTELLRAVDHTEERLREIASRWHDSIPPRARWELLQLANPLLRLLIRAGLR